VYQSADYSHLPVFESHQDIAILDMVPDIIWVFDLDRHGFWWGNGKALDFWGLDQLQQLIDKDLSADTEGARKRTEQTFEKAAAEGMTVDPWTTYPDGKARTLMMRHKAVLVGPERHRAIVAFISEHVDLGEQPEHLLFVEAVRYTAVAVTTYSMSGKPLFENPASSEMYGYEARKGIPKDTPLFVSRFSSLEEGWLRLELAQGHKESRQEHLMVTRDGLRRHTVDIRISRHPLSGEYVLLVSEYDVTALHDALQDAENAKEELRQLANYDSLTGLAGNRLCKDRLDMAIHWADRNSGKVALMFIDLDGFKQINDNHGHQVGDQILQSVAGRLSDAVRASDTVARIGGDEFLVLLPDVHCPDDAATVAQHILKALEPAFVITKEHCEEVAMAELGASIGITLYPDRASSAEELILLSDLAMYKVKHRGKNGYEFA